MDHTGQVDYQQVRDEYLSMMNEQVEMVTDNTKCSADMVWDILGLASVTRSSIHASCDDLEDAPTSEGILYQIRKGWLAHQVAVDLTYIPYHGEAQSSEDEVRRGQAKSGTTHFHVYASAYIIRKNKRVTVAVAYWRADQTLLEVVQNLLKRLRTLDIRLKRLLLDRQFCTVEVIRFLDQQPWQSILPVPARSNTLKALKQSARRSHTLTYTMRSPVSGEISFTLHAVCCYARGRRGKQGIDCLLFVVLGRPWPSSPASLADTYRSRFGIETSLTMSSFKRAFELFA
jgi:putative transposase